ncbi:MAG: DUF2950 domain-containing protein [Ramlibacter sp.]
MNITTYLKSGATRIAMTLLLALPLAAVAQDARTFATPEAAADALLAALKANDEAALLALVGGAHKGVIGSGDAQADAATRAQLAQHLQAFRAFDTSKPDRRVLLIGTQAWPLPIPIVRKGDGWRFAAEQGAEELANRRIGANELHAIKVLLAYVDAQRSYASRDRNGDGVLEYAQKLGSTAGKQDGLYWPDDSKNADEASPLGPLIAQSGYAAGRQPGSAFRGYHFRILTRQGAAAPGGAYNYVINGRMIAGFALVAYPATYGESGIMSFIVNHNGQVYEKDLGPNSAKAAAGMASFDPGAGWKKTTP